MYPESSRGLSIDNEVQLQGARLRIPSVIRCGATIVMVKIALRIWGVGRVITWLRRRVEAVPVATLDDDAAVKASERAVALAGALYPGRALCLEQSLVLYYLLRRQGVLVEYCQGVIPRPFQAHAWIEYRGEVINDIAEHARQFARLPDLLP
jgi:hypothetical protein